MNDNTWDDFDAFVALRGPALWRSAWLLIGDAHRAEDLVQTALTNCYTRWPTMPQEEFEAYVRTSMYHTFCSWWRRKWRGEVPTSEPVASDSSPSSAATDVVPVDVARALAALPRMQRAVVVCRYFEDLSEARTAQVLGISVGTVKSHTSRALAALSHSPLIREDDHA